MAPSLAIGQSIGRWGNFINQEAYGAETSNFMRMGLIENGNYIEVHPTFFYESMATLIIFIFLFVLSKKRKYSGEVTYMYFILYSLSRFFIEGIRIDSLMFYQFRISQLISIVLFIIFTSILIYSEKKSRKRENNVEK